MLFSRRELQPSQWARKFLTRGWQRKRNSRKMPNGQRNSHRTSNRFPRLTCTLEWRGGVVYFAVDSGATNTMVFLVEDGRVTGDARKSVGVRNTSIAGNPSLLRNSLRELIESLAKEASSPPRFVLAAGMITSSLGLLEVRHVVAPAGAEKLSQNVRLR